MREAQRCSGGNPLLLFHLCITEASSSAVLVRFGGQEFEEVPNLTQPTYSLGAAQPVGLPLCLLHMNSLCFPASEEVSSSPGSTLAMQQNDKRRDRWGNGSGTHLATRQEHLSSRHLRGYQ